jgi:hypothetical protein
MRTGAAFVSVAAGPFPPRPAPTALREDIVEFRRSRTMRKRAGWLEFFHIALLDVLARRMEPSRYVLKGGVNLRYFFGCQRYSEDIDLDLGSPPPWGLEKTIDGVLASPPLRALLRVGGLESPNSRNRSRPRPRGAGRSPLSPRVIRGRCGRKSSSATETGTPGIGSTRSRPRLSRHTHCGRPESSTTSTVPLPSRR